LLVKSQRRPAVFLLYFFSLLPFLGFLAAAPLYVLRGMLSRGQTVILGLLGAALLSFVAGPQGGLFYALAVILVMAFHEAEKAGFSVLVSGSFATALALGVCLVCLALWQGVMGENLIVSLETKLNVFLSWYKTNSGGKELLDVNAFLAQLPSGFIIFCGMSIWAAKVISPVLLARMGRSVETAKGRLLHFVVPGWGIWALIISFSSAFLHFSQGETVQFFAMNVFNVFAFLYFAQGIAVVAAFFQRQKLSPLAQSALFVLMIVAQLMLAVVLIGLADYWLEFRKKIFKEISESLDEVKK
jgi:hypothetical protein